MNTSFDSQNILITGGAGFVGRNLLRVMREAGIDMSKLTVIDKVEANNLCQKYGVKFIQDDLAEKGAWEESLKDQDVLVILHAQISSPNSADFYRNNVEATINVVNAAKKNGHPKIIHFSSAAVLSSRQDDYAKTKKISEEIIENSGLPYVIIRPSIMYGPTDDKNIAWLMNFMKKIPIFPIPGNGKYPRQPMYIDDVCLMVIGLIKNFPQKNKTYSINGKEQVFFKDIVKSVIKEMGGLRFAIYLPVPLYLFLVKIYNVLFHSPFTPDQIQSLINGDVFPDYPWWDEFGIKATPFSEGIKKTIKVDE